MNTKEFNELVIQIRKEIRKTINIGKTLHLLDKLRKVTHTRLDDIDLDSLIKSLNKSNEVKDKYLSTFSSNFFKTLLRKYKPKTLKELSILVGIVISNGTYKNNAEILTKKINIYDIPTNVDDLIDYFEIKDEKIINKIKRNKFDEEYKMYIKEHKFPKQYAIWVKDYALKINYLFSREEILLKTIISLYLFYFLTDNRELYFHALESLSIKR